jgi:cephalosporin-C deacetylase
MDKLAQTPVTYDTQWSEKREGYLFSRIEFKSIEGRPAWGNLAEPEKDGKCPAILKLPPVGTQAPGIDFRTERGFVTLGVEMFGHDPRWPQEKINEFHAKGGVKYEPLEAKGKRKPEDFWHYYAYCTLARAYDLLENHAKVDRNRIYITGVSQGGGLALAAAGLRPQNAGAVAVVPGLCRLDWANTNRGAWGPRIPQGADFDSMVRMLGYFETAYLVRNLRSRLVVSVGLFDDHTPPHAAASVFNEVPLNIRERKLIVGPWIGHGGMPELETYIPRWAREGK